MAGVVICAAVVIRSSSSHWMPCPLIPRSPIAASLASTSLPRLASPQLVFSTHFDCVPPFFPSRIEGGLLYGRGACDAKGILAAQVAAAERLRAAGETRIGLVFVAGEERGSDGAKAANRIASQSRFLINGEPTDLRLGSATRGVFRVRLTAAGKAAHSGYPELGESAIEKLLDCLMALRTRRLAVGPAAGHDPLHRGPHQRRRGAQRDSAQRRGRSVLPHGWGARCGAGDAGGGDCQSRDDAGDPRVAGREGYTPFPGSRPRCSLTSATCRSCRTGGRRSCWDRAPFMWPTRIVSTLPLPNWTRPWIFTRFSLRRCSWRNRAGRPWLARRPAWVRSDCLFGYAGSSGPPPGFAPFGRYDRW